MSSDRIIVALDVPYAHMAWTLTSLLLSKCKNYKIGFELFTDGGMKLVRQMALNDNIMLDLKINDVPTTIERTAARIASGSPKPKFLTYRCDPGQAGPTTSAILKGLGGSDIIPLYVPVLSSEGWGSFDHYYLRQAVAEAYKYGCRGYVTSGSRIEVVRKEVGEDSIIVSPGVRPEGSETNEHKELMTPKEAFEAGASYIVIGRPITQAENPVKAFDEIAESLC